MTDGKFLALFIGGIFFLLFVLTFVVGTANYYAGRSQCTSWGEATNRETRFVHLVEVGIPLSWDCFTPDEGGRWIPKDRVRDID